MDNNLEIIQVNEQLELHLGYVGGQSVGGIQEETDPIYTADKPNIALKSEIPVKVSDLQNDSGFISSIPQNLVTQEELNNKGYLTEFTQSDPVYSKDKPNLALKSELFSKSYNDLTDKPDIYTPKADGEGNKFLADDGSYKEIDQIDFSNCSSTKYNFILTDAEGNQQGRITYNDSYLEIFSPKGLEITGSSLRYYHMDGFYNSVDFRHAPEFILPQNIKIMHKNGSLNKLSLINLPMRADLQNTDGYFKADFTLGVVVQKYLNNYAISDGILNFKINEDTYEEGTCPTIEVMIPYTTDLTTFVFDENIQQIQIPETIPYNDEYPYNYAVFVVRNMNNIFQVNYSYSFGENLTGE